MRTFAGRAAHDRRSGFTTEGVAGPTVTLPCTRRPAVSAKGACEAPLRKVPVRLRGPARFDRNEAERRWRNTGSALSSPSVVATPASPGSWRNEPESHCEAGPGTRINTEQTGTFVSMVAGSRVELNPDADSSACSSTASRELQPLRILLCPCRDMTASGKDPDIVCPATTAVKPAGSGHCYGLYLTREFFESGRSRSPCPTPVIIPCTRVVNYTRCRVHRRRTVAR